MSSVEPSGDNRMRPSLLEVTDLVVKLPVEGQMCTVLDGFR